MIDLSTNWTIIRVPLPETLVGWNTPPPILIAGGHTLNAISLRIPVSLMTFPQSPRLFTISCLSGYQLTHNDQPHTLGYGFDDGPNCSHNAFYDFLLKQNQKASKSFSLIRRISILIQSENSYVLYWQ